MARSENMTRAEIAVGKVEEERENAFMARSKNTPAGVTNTNKHAIAKVEN